MSAKSDSALLTVGELAGVTDDPERLLRLAATAGALKAGVRATFRIKAALVAKLAAHRPETTEACIALAFSLCEDLLS